MEQFKSTVAGIHTPFRHPFPHPHSHFSSITEQTSQLQNSICMLMRGKKPSWSHPHLFLPFSFASNLSSLHPTNVMTDENSKPSQTCQNTDVWINTIIFTIYRAKPQIFLRLGRMLFRWHYWRTGIMQLKVLCGLSDCDPVDLKWGQNYSSPYHSPLWWPLWM